MTKIKTIEDACVALGTTVEIQFPDGIKSLMTPDEIAYRELKIITKALNQSDGDEWEPNWNNNNEYKYYPWFDMETYNDAPAGSGFSYNDCAHVGTYSSVGSHLCFKSRQLAEYAGKEFLETYKRFFLIQK